MNIEPVIEAFKIPANFLDEAKKRASELQFADVDDYIHTLAIRHCCMNNIKFYDYLEKMLPKKNYRLSSLFVPMAPAISIDELPSYYYRMSDIGIEKWKTVKIHLSKYLSKEIHTEADRWRVSPGRYLTFLVARDICNNKAFMMYRLYFDPIWCCRIMSYIPEDRRAVPNMFKSQFKITDNIPELHPAFPWKENKIESFLPYLDETSDLRKDIADRYYGR